MRSTSQLIVNGQTLTIVGVAPRGFDGTTMGSKPQVFVPITLRGTMEPGFQGWANRQTYWAYLFARLRPGVPIETARATLNGHYHAIVNDVEAPLQKGMSEQTMNRFRSKLIEVKPGGHGQSSTPDEAKTPLYMLMGVTLFVLLIACANIANLLLARSAARAGEMAIRLSIGATRWNLIAQLLTESLLLAVFGGIAGIFVAHWTLRLIMSLLPAQTAQILAFKIDTPVILFGAAVTIATGLLFGLFPALHSTRPDLLSTLKGQSGQPSGARGRGAIPPRARHRTDRAVAGIARCRRILRQEPAQREPRRARRQDRQRSHVRSLAGTQRLQAGAHPRLLRAARGETGGRTRCQRRHRLAVPLLGGSNWGSDVAVQGFQSGPDTDSNARFNEIGAGYFRTLGVPLMSGREFTTADEIKPRKS